MASMLEGDTDEYRTEKRLLHVDGHDIWVALSTTIVRDIDDSPQYFLSHFLDITDRKQFESELHHLADHDPMTGLANRRRFKAMLNRQVSTVARHGQTGALLVLDLDNFKQINDTLGHHAGDELIISLAAVVRRSVRATDLIGRLGGDEFAVLLPYATREHAEHVASKLLDAIRDETTLLAGTHPRKVTTSIGIAMFDDPTLTGAEVLINADLAMYDAKEAGRDRYAVHEATATQPTTRARLAWVDRISNALEHDRFTLYAQPIMHLATRQITRHELLLRMIEDDGKVISPATFLGVAEKFGLINRVDRWVVDHAITALATTTPSEIKFEINLSGISMNDKDLLAFIEQRLLESPTVKPSQLIFEVTETAAVANLSAAREFADRLTTLGCSFALDDFGAGFGSFFYLKYLPFDDLKIDGEFITHCLSNPTDQLLIDAVVTLAKGLDKCTIAEFVGDQDTLEFLAARGVDYAQGFHVGHPVPLEHAIEDPPGVRVRRPV
jgi:diguanylate cyclase (GGDEF)-like protein